MAIDSKYGIITTQYGYINEDEPVVIFRAQDKIALTILKIYRDLYALLGGNRDMLTILDADIKAFEVWRKKKLPD